MDYVQSDDTTSLNLKRDFNAFISGSGQRRPHMNRHGLHFNLNELDISSAEQQSSLSLSMQLLKEQDQHEKRKEAEIISAKTHISELESKIAKLETSNKKARIEYETDLGSILQEKEQKIIKLSEYKEKWQYLMDKEEEAREQLKETRKELDICKSSYEQKISKLQQGKLQLEEDLHQSQEAMRVKVMEMKNELWRQTTELDICKNELEETKAHLKLQLRRSTETNAQMKELEEYRLKTLDAESKKKELEKKVQQFEEDSILVKSMKTQLSRVPELEREIRSLTDQNSYFRETQENVVLIKEQMEGLRSRLQRADQRCGEIDKLQVENEILKKKIQKWELSDSDDLKQISPVELKRQLAESQNAELLYLEKNGQLQSRIRTLEDHLQVKEEENRKNRTSTTQKSSRLQQQEDLVKRLQKKLLLIAKERDAFKRILDSYESEMTVNLDVHTGSRLQQQDESIQVYQKQVEQLENDLQRTGEHLTHERLKTQQLEQRLQEVSCKSSPVDENSLKTVKELRVRIAELESKLETVEEEKFILESRIEQRHLQGDYDPMKTKVVHFRMNPAAVAQAQRAEEFKKMKEENIKLKERLKILEESGGQVQDLTFMVEQKVQDNQGLSYDDLKAKLGLAEIKTQRLMEAFKERSQELRQICYELTGYKIDMCNTNQYRLTNRYAESPNDWLLFQQSSSGEVQMLETEYSSTIQGLMDIYLGKQESIPGLLSAVTLELLSLQTMKP